MENQSQLISYTYNLVQDISNPVFSSSKELEKLLSEYVKSNKVSYYMVEPHKYRKEIASKLDKIKAIHPKYDQAATSLKECLDLHPVLSIGITTGNHCDTDTAVFHNKVVEVIGSIADSILVIESHL